jgi:hypothetical protein
MCTGGSGKTHGQNVTARQSVDVDGHGSVSGQYIAIAKDVGTVRGCTTAGGGSYAALTNLSIVIKLVEKRHASMHVLPSVGLVPIYGTSDVHDTDIRRIGIGLLLYSGERAGSVFT